MSSVQHPVALALDHGPEKIPLDVQTTKGLTSQTQNFDLDEIDFLKPRLIPIQIEPEPPRSQLGRPEPQRNNTEEESIPRQIITESAPVQSRVQRPIISGTFRNQKNTYLIVLEFHLSTPRENQGWSSRMQGVDIVVEFKDAPNRDTGAGNTLDDSGSSGNGQEHPTIMDSFPGPQGWQGAPATAHVTKKISIGVGVGIEGLLLRTKTSKTSEGPKVGRAKMAVRRRSNAMRLYAYENPVSENGVPSYLAIPMVVKHRDRRFQMEVTVKPYFRFWSLNIAERVRTWGQTDEPIYFDPMRMDNLRLNEIVDDSGVKIVESGGVLDELNLEDRSTLEQT